MGDARSAAAPGSPDEVGPSELPSEAGSPYAEAAVEGAAATAALHASSERCCRCVAAVPLPACVAGSPLPTPLICAAAAAPDLVPEESFEGGFAGPRSSGGGDDSSAARPASFHEAGALCGERETGRAWGV